MGTEGHKTQSCLFHSHRSFQNRQSILRVMEALDRATEEVNPAMEALDRATEELNRAMEALDRSTIGIYMFIHKISML